ncbi:MAG: AIR synthase related protein [Clostridiales bacterium]
MNSKNIKRNINDILSGNENKFKKFYDEENGTLKIGDKNLLLTTSEFSRDNLLRESDPYILGWNVGVASFSSMIARGVNPVYFYHTLIISDKWNKQYLESFVMGISDVVEAYEIPFIRGTYHLSGKWRFNASVLGVMDKKLLKPNLAVKGDSIYITGYIGRGNVEAFLSKKIKNRGIERLSRTYKNRFRIRRDESNLIKNFSEACIDTKDGFINSLNRFVDLGKVGYKLSSIPYVKSGILAVKMLEIPKELLLTGNFGEYELIFTIKKERESEFLKTVSQNDLNIFKIGTIVEEGIKVFFEDEKEIDFSNNKNSKEIVKVKEYKAFLKTFFRNNFKS